MLRAFGFGIAALFFPLSVAAQSVQGNYTVSGTNPDGSLYTGAAKITFEGADCKLVMTFGNGDVAGICVQSEELLATSYVASGALTLVLYRLQPNGVLNGTWSVAGMAGTGSEVMTPE